MAKRVGTKLESDVQSRIIKRYVDEGWLVVKISLCNLGGFPDLMCLKDGKAIFIEVKREGCKARQLQEYRLDQLRNLGFEAFVQNG